MERARTQREAVEKIEQKGGYVAYDWETDWVATPPIQKPYPAWLRGILGDNFFFDVVEASFLRSDFDDENAVCLNGLANLERLYLDHTCITDAGLENISELPRLKELTLDYTQLSDVGLQHLAGLTNLEHLGLGGTQVTNVGLTYLEELRNLLRLAYSMNEG